MFQFFGGVERLFNRYRFYDRTTTLATPTGMLAGVAWIATEFYTAVDDDVFLTIGSITMVICRPEDTDDRGSDGNRDVHGTCIIADIKIAGCDKRSDLTQIIFFYTDRLLVHQIGSSRLQLPLIRSSKQQNLRVPSFI